MKSILLDTHVWIWAEEDVPYLGAQARQLIQNTKVSLWLSPISSLEIAQLVFKGRITIKAELKNWIERSVENFRFQHCELTHEIGIAAYALPGEFHLDPADRVLVASARAHGMSLLTADKKILSYGHVEAVDASQ